MKHTIFLLFAASALFFSCSADDKNDDKEAGQNSIEGSWDATELKTEDPNADFGKQILNHLTDKECYILTFTFNSDLSVVADNSVNYLDVNVGGTGIDIPCPDEKDTNSSTYTYDGQVLTIQDYNGQPLSAAVSVDGGVMEVDAKDLNIPNFDYSGQLVFTKR